MAQRRDKPGFSMTMLVWAATGIGLLAVVAALLFVTLRTPPPVPPVVAQQRTSLPTKPPPAETEPVSTIPQSPAAMSLQKPPAVRSQASVAAPVAGAIPVTQSTAEKPELLLNHLAGTLRVRLPDVATPGDRLPLDHTCYRNNQSPALEWNHVPMGAQSLVVILERQETNKPPAWTWILFNINPANGRLQEHLLKSGQLPDGALYARNVYNKAEYLGPCEPRGKIPYALRLFALDTMLNLPAGVSRDDLVRAMNGHIIDATEFDMVHYLRF